MPSSNMKVFHVVMEEVETIEERREGYREELVSAIAEIIEAERQHQVRGTNIQQKVNDRCSDAGGFLYESRTEA